MDLESVLADQRDLASLIGSRYPRTPEPYPSSDDYGMATILKAYAGFPIQRPLRAIIPHGVYFLGDVSLEVQAPVRGALSYPEYLDDAYRAGLKTVVPVASPFLYALEIAAMREGCADPEGTIFFPYHGTTAVGSTFAVDEAIAHLRALPDEFQPVTVSIHWHDWQQGLHGPYADAGFPIVSAGHVTDPLFLVRLALLMSCYRFATGTGAGSSILYATAAGLPYFDLGVEVEHTTDDERFARIMKHADTSREREVLALFAERRTDITSERQAAADHYLRADALKQPEELLADLEEVAAL